MWHQVETDQEIDRIYADIATSSEDFNGICAKIKLYCMYIYVEVSVCRQEIYNIILEGNIASSMLHFILPSPHRD